MRRPHRVSAIRWPRCAGSHHRDFGRVDQHKRMASARRRGTPPQPLRSLVVGLQSLVKNCHLASEEEEQVFQSITSAVVTLVSTGLDRWARAQPPSSAMLMVHTHLRGAGQGKPSSSTEQPRRGPRARAGNPGLHFILAKKRLPDRLWLLGQKMVSTAQWQALSPLSGKSVERTASPSQRRPARRPPWKSFWTLRGLERRTPSWGSHGPVAWVKQEEAWRAICLQPTSGS